MRSRFLLVATLIYAVFGLGLLLVPGPFMAAYDVQFDADGTLLARVAGALLLSFGVALFLSRNADPAAARPLLLAGLVYNLIELPVTLMAIQSGVMNTMGWLPFALHVGLVALFGWYVRARA
jgi:hypothetical protein